MNDSTSLETIAPELERILNEVKRLAERCDKRLIKLSEFLDLMNGLVDGITRVVPPGSDTYRVFERDWGQRTPVTSKSLDAYLNPKDCVQFHQLTRVLQAMIETIAPDFLKNKVRDEYYLHAGDEYFAKKIMWTLLRRAAKSLAIVDEYLDESVFPYIDSLPQIVSISLLTGRKKPMFGSLLLSLQKRQSNVNAKENTECHDRFVIIDSAEIWHVGASLNALGVKASRISLIKDETERSKFLSDFQRWWANGQAF